MVYCANKSTCKGRHVVSSDNQVHLTCFKDTSDRRPKSRAQRGVRFNEDVETIPITSRVEHLRRVIDEESREEHALHTQSLRSVYRNQLRDLQREEHGIKKGKRKTKQVQFGLAFCNVFPLQLTTLLRNAKLEN